MAEGAENRAGVHVHAGPCSLAQRPDLTVIRRLTVADSYARFRRMRGDDVLLSLGFDSGDAANDGGAREQGQEGLQHLGLSFDWSHSLTDTDPAAERWSEQIFRDLLEAGHAERSARPLDWCDGCRTLLPVSADQPGQCRQCQRPLERMPEGQWYMRLDPYVERAAEQGDLGGEGDATSVLDRLLGRVDGVELEVQAFDSTQLVVFTPLPDAIAEAKFVALSPDHPELERWMQEPEAEQRLAQLRAGQSDAGGRGLDYPTLMESGMWVQVPGGDDLLPLIISLAVDARYGATAALGIPSSNPVDERLAEHLPPPPTLRVRSNAKQGKARPTVRFRARALPVSSSQRRAAAIPMLATMPAGDRMEAGFEHPELRRWLAINTTLHDADDPNAMLLSGALLEALRSLGRLDFIPGEAPPTHDFLTGRIDTNGAGAEDGELAPDALAEQAGADAVRFALLYAAAPPKNSSSSEFKHILRLAETFLARLRAYAEPRLATGDSTEVAIDPSSPLRRRLTAWCDVALRKTTANYAELKTHRATRNTMLLLERIEDFERRAAAEGEDLSPEDAEAVRSALLLLVVLLAPIAPHVCDELWQRAGGSGPIGEAPWPARTRRGDAQEPQPAAAEAG